MKTKFKILLLTALTSLAALPAVRAADSDTPPPPDRPRMKEMGERRLKQLDEKLHLTAEQKTKILGIWESAAQQQARAKQDADKERGADRRETMRATREQIRAILTPEQQKIFDEMPRNGPPPRHKDGAADGH